MLRLIPLLIIFSGCVTGSMKPSHDVERPDADLCFINATLKHKKCYNLKADYNQDGSRKPSAKARFYPLPDVSAIDSNVCADPKSFEALKAYFNLLRALDAED